MVSLQRRINVMGGLAQSKYPTVHVPMSEKGRGKSRVPLVAFPKLDPRGIKMRRAEQTSKMLEVQMVSRLGIDIQFKDMWQGLCG